MLTINLLYAVVQTTWFTDTLNQLFRKYGKLSLVIGRVKYDIHHPLEVSFYKVTLSKYNQPAIMIAKMIKLNFDMDLTINTIEAEHVTIAPNNYGVTPSIHMPGKILILRNMTVMASTFSPEFTCSELVIHLNRAKNLLAQGFNLAAKKIEFHHTNSKILTPSSTEKESTTTIKELTFTNTKGSSIH